MNVPDVAYLFTTLVILATLGIIVFRMIKHKSCRLTLLPILIWCVHGLAFCITRSVDTLNGEIEYPLIYNAWSSILRLQSFLTVLILQIFAVLSNNIKVKNGHN